MVQEAGHGITDDNISIEVRDVTKDFRVYRDKSHTFKDRVLFRKRNAFKKHRVLDRISFTVKRGQALGLIGHNGCGKSTTLKLLNKILYPDSGEIVMHGRISSLIELGAGFHPDMTGRENIYINASIFGLHKREIDNRLDDIIRFSELESFIDNPVRTYSSGMYMRLAFSIAINVDADILLVDEILAVGDANFQKKCFEKLEDIKKHGVTIVIVSHSMDQIKSICDSVIWLDKGRICAQGDAEDVCAKYLAAMDDIARERHREELREPGLNVQEDPNIQFPISQISTQYGIYSRRSGNMKFRFQHIAMLNGNGEKCQRFHYGESLIVDFSFSEWSENLVDPDLNIVFNIFHSDGRFCSHFTTKQSSIILKKGDLRKGRFEIKEIRLSEGKYILDAVIAHGDEEAYDCLSHMIEFTVGTPVSLGTQIAAMENTWMFAGEK